MTWIELMKHDLNDFNHALKKISNKYLKQIRADKIIVELLDFNNLDDSTIESLREELQLFAFADFDFKQFQTIFKEAIEATSSNMVRGLGIIPLLEKSSLSLLEDTNKITLENLQILQNNAEELKVITIIIRD